MVLAGVSHRKVRRLVALPCCWDGGAGSARNIAIQYHSDNVAIRDESAGLGTRQLCKATMRERRVQRLGRSSEMNIRVVGEVRPQHGARKTHARCFVTPERDEISPFYGKRPTRVDGLPRRT